MPYKPVFCFDLELNQPSNKIIEVGYCVGDLPTGAIVNAGSHLVTLDEPLDAFVSRLTAIRQGDLDTGAIPLFDAFVHMKTMMDCYGCWNMPLQWGMGDLDLLATQVKAILVAQDKMNLWTFSRRAIDVKACYQLWALSQPTWAFNGKGRKVRCGLSKALMQLDLTFDGRKHSAKDDAKNTFRMAYELSKYMRMPWED